MFKGHSTKVGMLLLALGVCLPTASSQTLSCGGYKSYYNGQGCCGNDDKSLSCVPGAPLATNYAACKPNCAEAEPQAPRDLTNCPGANCVAGQKKAKATVLTNAQAQELAQANVHFHLGAEHKSNAYNDATDSTAFDTASSSRRLEGNTEDDPTRRLASGAVRPGFMCSNTGLSTAALDKSNFTWQHCSGVEIGKTYEIHYVHSSAGYSAEDIAGDATMEQKDAMADGLGGAAFGRGLLNPMLAVEALVIHITNDGATIDDLVHGWTVAASNGYSPGGRVQYMGSTTGPSHNNDNICSPFAVTWHVDLACHQVTPASFDKMCKDMKDLYGLVADLKPHGSRVILDPKWVVPANEVTAM